jgi:hypothetical protein
LRKPALRAGEGSLESPLHLTLPETQGLVWQVGYWAESVTPVDLEPLVANVQGQRAHHGPHAAPESLALVERVGTRRLGDLERALRAPVIEKQLEDARGPAASQDAYAALRGPHERGELLGAVAREAAVGHEEHVLGATPLLAR